MTATAVAAGRRGRAGEDLLTAYAAHCKTLGMAASSVDLRLAAARAFLSRHCDVAAWMTRPLRVRLTDLARNPLAWPLVGFAVLTGRVRSDFDLLAAKHVGRSFAPAVAAIYPEELAVLRAAATRLDWAKPWTAGVLGQSLPLLVAMTGRAPRTSHTSR